MSENPDLDATLQEMKTKAAQVKTALATITGIGTAANGAIVATVDAAGHLRDLKLPRDTARLGPQLATLILQATAEAENDAHHKSAAAVRPLTSDDRVASGLKTIRETLGAADSDSTPHRVITEEEIQAADDAYFERMNRGGWNQ
ncbi:YbaB/EbfC family nucleoid-associated protein [Nocardia nova]|uniref:YbaB/EbfC family nucleoid-associated protein n=1 Tax=Nocardia nova TaxID=37330 RepID=UPI001895837E|nr:YbaB/EbfC family nucleoid-associated protein [Nocardia nova]MBF6150216.1 YbaB/EbfC family nucleoid-associated protein [Nocardia nova]